MSKKIIESKHQIESSSMNNYNLLLITFGLTLVYFGFSRFSDGFYMHDEVANFLSMQNFWNEPSSILGANAKTGYKLFYILPALGGYSFLQFFNSIIAAFTVYFSYKTLVKLNSKHSLLIVFLLGIQPLWFMLSFRNYAEMLVAFLMVLAVYQHLNKKYVFAALIISYVAFTRTELHVVSGLYFLWLIFNKKWIPALLTGTFSLANALIGFIMTGDILHIVHDTQQFSESIKGAYPHQGFDHYFLMSSVIFGSGVIILFFNYIGATLLNKSKINWIIFVPTVLIFLLNCLFNALFVDFGPGGGSLRYLLTMAPLITILGILSLDELIAIQKKYLLLILILPVIVLIGIYQTYEHNFIKFSEIRSWSSLIFALITTILILLPLKPKHYIVAFSFYALAVSLSIVDTRKIQPEEEIVKKAAKWYNDQLRMVNNPQNTNPVLFTEDSRVAVEHSLFYFYSGKNRKDFKNKPVGLIKEETDLLKKGDLVIWDSHYGYRPELRKTSQKFEYYDSNPKFQKIQYYQSNDKRFMIVFFLKTTDN